jgi:hypothetical protein
MRNFSEMLLRARQALEFSHDQDPYRKYGEHYSITSSARASSVGGTSRPSAFAVLRLIANSY